MNDLIYQQLNKVKIADLPPFDGTTIHLMIPKKKITEEITIVEDGYYLIELEDYLLHPAENFTLHTNWNNGIVPQDKFMKCHCTKVMGKMFKIDGVGFDYQNKRDLDSSEWTGWLPTKSVKVLREI